MKNTVIISALSLILTSGLVAQTLIDELVGVATYGGHVGDVNGDGYDDIVSGSQNPFGSNTISVWLVDEYGLDTDVDVVITGDTGSMFGTAVAVGDLNGDDIDDIVVSASKDTVSDIPGVGAVYVFYGASTWGSGTIADSLHKDDADEVITRKTAIANEWYGWNVAIGDFNHDCDEDLAIGGLYTDGLLGRIEIRLGPDVADTSYVQDTLGVAGGYDHILNGFADSTKSAPVWGTGPGYFAGGALDVGDFNGDGADDIFTSNYGYGFGGEFTNNNQPGMLSVYLGGEDADELADHYMIAPADIVALEKYLYFGYRAVNAGDVNNDGTDDFLGASHSWGVAMLWSGERGLAHADTSGVNTSAELDREPLVTIIEPGATYGYNSSTFNIVGALGDINGDGYDDFAVGNPSDSTEVATGKNGDGAVHIFLGGKGPLGTADVVMYGSDAEGLGAGMWSVGDVDADGLDDFAVSAVKAGKIKVYSGAGLTAGIADAELVPTGFTLSQNFPNPFNPNTEIAYEIPAEAMVSLKVYNMLGQEVSTIINKVQTPGAHNVSWGGLNNRGEMVASGIYTYVLNVDGVTMSRKMLLMR